MKFEDRSQEETDVDRYTSHVILLMHFAHVITLTSWLKVSQCAFHSIHVPSMMSHVWVCVCCLFVFVSFLFLSHFYLFFSVYLFSVRHASFHVVTAEGQNHCTDAQWGVLPLAIYNSLTGYEPKLLDNFDSETSAMIFQDESGDIDTEPSYSCDAELDGEIVGRALSSPLFTQEREDPANLRQAYRSNEESLLPAQSFVAHTSTGRPVYELGSFQKTKINSRNGERIRSPSRNRVKWKCGKASTERPVLFRNPGMAARIQRWSRGW